MSKYWIKFVAYGVILGAMGMRIWKRSRTCKGISATMPDNLGELDVKKIRKLIAAEMQVPAAWI
jgi:hypothetical protein